MGGASRGRSLRHLGSPACSLFAKESLARGLVVVVWRFSWFFWGRCVHTKYSSTQRIVQHKYMVFILHPTFYYFDGNKPNKVHRSTPPPSKRKRKEQEGKREEKRRTNTGGGGGQEGAFAAFAPTFVDASLNAVSYTVTFQDLEKTLPPLPLMQGACSLQMWLQVAVQVAGWPTKSGRLPRAKKSLGPREKTVRQTSS